MSTRQPDKNQKKRCWWRTANQWSSTNTYTGIPKNQCMYTNRVWFLAILLWNRVFRIGLALEQGIWNHALSSLEQGIYFRNTGTGYDFQWSCSGTGYKFQRFLLWNRVRVQRAQGHIPTLNGQEYPPPPPGGEGVRGERVTSALPLRHPWFPEEEVVWVYTYPVPTTPESVILESVLKWANWFQYLRQRLL